MLALTGAQIREPIKLVVALWTGIRAILWNHQTICTQRLPRLAAEHIPLNEDLVIAPTVDGLVQEIFV